MFVRTLFTMNRWIVKLLCRNGNYGFTECHTEESHLYLLVDLCLLVRASSLFLIYQSSFTGRFIILKWVALIKNIVMYICNEQYFRLFYRKTFKTLLCWITLVQTLIALLLFCLENNWLQSLGEQRRILMVLLFYMLNI